MYDTYTFQKYFRSKGSTSKQAFSNQNNKLIHIIYAYAINIIIYRNNVKMLDSPQFNFLLLIIKDKDHYSKNPSKKYSH